MSQFFHVAPTAARVAITREGLDGRARRHLYLDRPDRCCVYLFKSMDAAACWAVKELVVGEQAFAGDWDIWRVDVALSALHADESADFVPEDGACFTVQPVDPARLTLIGTATVDMAERLLEQQVAERLAI